MRTTAVLCNTREVDVDPSATVTDEVERFLKNQKIVARSIDHPNQPVLHFTTNTKGGKLEPGPLAENDVCLSLSALLLWVSCSSTGAILPMRSYLDDPQSLAQETVRSSCCLCTPATRCSTTHVQQYSPSFSRRPRGTVHVWWPATARKVSHVRAGSGCRVVLHSC